MSQPLTEDDIYRTSTQFRLWNFAPEALASLRASTHQSAIERAGTYLSVEGNENTANGGEGNSIEAQCLSLEEEMKLVQRSCDQIRSTCDHFKFPVNVKATAVQYLRRFYLTNSCLTYPPKEIYKSILFLASKTEGAHMPLGEYGRRIATAPEQILAPEYKIIQALRFTLDVRQPFRGLRGALMELLNLIDGKAAILPNADGNMTAESLQKEVSTLAAPPSTALTQWQPNSAVVDRAQLAYSAARQLLDANALLTDVYFLYTPSQIYMAALRLADPVLTDFYLSTKLPASSPMTPKILATIGSCADMLASYDAKNALSKEERAALEAKLDACRDPSTKDMVGLNAKAKRGDEDEAEEKAKRRKIEREASAKEGDDLFGPALGQPMAKVETGF